MAILEFTKHGKYYRAEVTVDWDMELDEILEVLEVASSGAVHVVTDTTDLEEAIEDTLASRAGELRERRNALLSKKVLDKEPKPGLQYISTVGKPPTAAVVQPLTKKEKFMTVTLTLKAVNKAGQATYTQPGARAFIRFPKDSFATGVAPDSLEINAPDGALTVLAPQVPKMTAEERKAAKAAQTPAEKVAEAKKRAEAAVARANKLAETLGL